MPGDLQVLIADDDQDIGDIVAFKLTQAGYTVRSVPDGVGALDHVLKPFSPLEPLRPVQAVLARAHW